MPNIGEVAGIADQRAEQSEHLGHLHPEVVEALVDARLFRLWVSKSCGGADASVLEALAIIETLSAADGATGWCTMIANCTALTSHRLPAHWAKAIYSDPTGCTGGFGMPAGRATLVDGGLEVSGHWAWGSGTDHCSWIGGGVLVVDETGEPASTPDGATAPFVFFERATVELLDTWHVAGLKATASTDYRVERAFVPDGRWVELTGTPLMAESTLSRFPFFSALAGGVAAVLIGLAQRAVDELVELGRKRPSGSSKSLAERAPVQADLALAVASIAQSRAYLYSAIEAAWERSEAGEEPDDQVRTEMRLAATAGARRCVEAVDICYHAAGGAAVYETSPLQRVFRDAHVAISHAMVAPRTLEPMGRLRFGLPTSTEQI